jgi:hypothetical protein
VILIFLGCSGKNWALLNIALGLAVFIGDVEVVGWGLGTVGYWRGKRVRIDYGGDRR